MDTAKQTPSIWKLAGFILKTRTRLIFSGTENTAINIGRIFLIIFLIFYAISAAVVLLTSDEAQRSLFYVLIIGTIPTIIISSGIFPVLKLPSSVVPGYAPLPGQQVGILNLIYNLFRPGTFYGLIFLGITTTLTYSLGPWLFIDGLLLIVAISALDYAVKQTVLSAQTRGIRGFGFLLTAGLVNMIGLGLYFGMYYFSMLGAPYVYSLYLLLFTISCVIYYTYTVELTETASSTSIFPDDSVGSESITSVSAATRLAYTRKQSTKPMYLLIPVFNVLVGAYIYYWAEDTMAEVFALMLAFPLLPFTYVHNNFWGFFRETWLAVRLSPSTAMVKWKVFLGALWIPLLLDAGSSLLALGFSGQFRLYHLTLYLILIPPVMLLSYWSSLRYPRQVNALLSINQITTFKNNTSGISSFITVLFCYGFSFTVVLGNYALSIAVVVVSCAILLFLIRQCEITQHYKIEAELFK